MRTLIGNIYKYEKERKRGILHREYPNEVGEKKMRGMDMQRLCLKERQIRPGYAQRERERKNQIIARCICPTLVEIS